MVSAMDRGEPVTAKLFIFLDCAAEDTPFDAYKVCFSAEERRSQHASPCRYYSHMHLSFY